MKEQVHKILEYIGEDPNRKGLQETPARVQKAFDFLTRGYRQDIKSVVNSAIFEEDANHMIIVKDIEIYSLCEHHMLPFFADATLDIFQTARFSVSAKLPESPIYLPADFKFKNVSQIKLRLH